MGRALIRTRIRHVVLAGGKVSLPSLLVSPYRVRQRSMPICDNPAPKGETQAPQVEVAVNASSTEGRIGLATLTVRISGRPTCLDGNL
ncbi:hypothetical protein Pth03_82280 [Planotetraspora thailandica]|uniref:Uncharacterized protein n=1 Tax=Planotetraspora thailandica TaxID=487172 RepID=A0A8J3Y340_9ACTN|nr:hypothetical protein Pth03_82280 [Planotetraspora thailandica]